MICAAKSCAVRARNLIELSSSANCHLRKRWIDIDVKPPLNSNWNRCKSKTSLKMMVDFSTSTGPQPISNLLEKNDSGDGGLVTGGGRSEDGKLSFGYASFQGRRANMEDFYDTKLSIIDEQTISLFGIFDGHGGSRAAEYLKEHLFVNLMKHPQFMTDTKLAISETYQKTDSEFLETERNTFRDDGSTASTAILIGKHLYVANVGDSRVVMSKAGIAIALSDDHKPNRGDERKRIEDAGGFVMWAGTWRVGGILAMSRAFGNRLLKPYVMAVPDIQVEGFDVPLFEIGSFSEMLLPFLHTCRNPCGFLSPFPLDQWNPLREEDVNEQVELLVLASDGLWDVIPNEEAIALARTEEEPEAAARTLTQTAFSRGSADNITCIVVRFHNDNLDVNFTSSETMTI